MRVLQSHLRILSAFVALMWAVQLLNLWVFQGSLVGYGIVPRSLSGLWGILFAPFLHGGWGHLMANTVPFVILGWLVMAGAIADFVVVTITTMIVAGLGTWLFGGPGTVHVGASGLIFGYLGYLLLRGYFERSVGAIALSILVGVVYGSMIWGILPTAPRISWQGHLFGFVGGAIAARYLAKPRSADPARRGLTF
jgi:membrane associated rhomboid family serine protease